MRSFPFVAILICLLATGATAQTLQTQNLLKAADQLIRDGDCENALQILTSAREETPDDPNILQMLEQAFICAREFDSAHAVIRQLIDVSSSISRKVVYLAEDGDIFLRQSLKDSAEAVFQAAIELDPTNSRAYQEAARTYLVHGYYNDAARIYQQGRKQLRSPTSFATDLGRLYEVMRNYGDAAREYFQLVANDTTQLKLIDSRMTNLIALAAGEDFATGLEEALADLVREHPDNLYAHKYFGEYLVAAGRIEDAFERYRVVDSLAEGKGAEIVFFCKLASEQGDYRMVEKAYQYLKSMYPGAPSLVSAGFILGRAYFANRLYQNAVNVYEDILTRSSGGVHDLADAMFFAGYTRYRGLHQPQLAVDIFNSLIDKYPATSSAKTAALYIADCHLAMAQPVVAESLYAAIQMRTLPQKFQEELLFAQGELYFFLGEYDAARQSYGDLMQSFPKSVYVNDCLRRIMLISEHPDMEEVTLRLYSQALYAEFRFEYDSALVIFDHLKSMLGSSLGELSWYHAGQIFSEMGESQQALIEFDSLVARYPKGSYAPLAVELKGDLYAGPLADYDTARQTYEDLLMNYPDCLNEEQVRKKLNRVEQIINRDKKNPKS